MNETTTERSPEETAEIQRHKYLLSEKAGHDVGWEFALQDWDSHHAQQFRQSTDSDVTPPADGETRTFFMRLLAKARKR